MTRGFITVVIFFCITTAFAADGDVYDKLLSFDYGQSREALWTIENRIREANDQQRVEIEKGLLNALKSPRATVAARRSICQLLPDVASCATVKELTPLLTNEQLQDAARGALEDLPCPEVDKLFRDTLVSVKGNARLALVSSIGARRDRGATALLAGLINSPDLSLVEATLSALGRVGGDPAATLIKQTVVPQTLQAGKADSYLRCAESFLKEGQPTRAETIYQEILKEPGSGPAAKAGALRGLVITRREAALDELLESLKSADLELRQAAARLVNEVPGPKMTQMVLGALPAVPPDTQVFLISALGNRADRQALPELKKQAESSSSQPVQIAALEALGKLGDQSCVDTLFKLSNRPDPVGATAAESLKFLRGPGVNDSIARYLQDSEPALRVLALRTLAARRFPAASDRAFELTADKDVRVRLEAWRTLGLTAGSSSLPRLVSEMLKLSEPREQQAAEQAVQATALQLTEPGRLQPLLDAMKSADSSQRCSLLRAMGRIGGEAAFTTIRIALSDTDPAIQDTAVRVLSDWGDTTTSADLLKLAKTATNPAAHRILGLRGYVRLAGKAEDPVPMFREALGIAERAEEKKLVLGALGGVGSVGALDLVEPFLADQALKIEAQAACLRLARSVAGQEPGRARAALVKLVESSEDPAVKQQAQDALKELEN